jgi:membrane peptidoglycan carboxypeptidase
MDMADGEVRFHLTPVIGELGLTSEMIEKHFMTAYFTMDRYFPAFMQHIHAGYTPEDAVFHAELDYNAERVEEASKPAPKPKAKAKPASSSDASSAQPATAASDAGSPPPSINPGQGSSNPPAPSSKKPHRKKSEGIQGQGELPL